MTALYIAGGIVALVTLLLFLPVFLTASYEQELSVEVKYLFITVWQYPKKEKKQSRLAAALSSVRKKISSSRVWRKIPSFFRKIKYKAKKLYGKIKSHFRKNKTEKKKKTGTSQKKKEKKEEKSALKEMIDERGLAGFISLMAEIAGMSLSRVGKILRGAVIDRFDLLIAVGGENAAEAAKNYGKVCAVLYPLLSMIMNAVRRYKKYIDIRPDFTAEQSRVRCAVKAHILPAAALHHALGLIVSLLIKLIKERVSEAAGELPQAEPEK